jgi:hypothetical protein
MGSMADTASLLFLGKVFENPRASLLGMTVETGLPISINSHLPQAGPLAGPVRSMAVRACQGSLHDFVGIGKVETRLDILVTGKTEINFIRLQEGIGHSGFVFLQERAAHSSPVHLVTVSTSHRTELMDASSELIKGLQFLMACEADIGLNAGSFTFESKDTPFSFGLCVLLSRAVAGLTFLPPVRVLLEGLVEIAVASLAAFRSNISFLDIFLVLAEARKTDHGYQQHHCEHQDHQIPNSDHNDSPRLTESGILNAPPSQPMNVDQRPPSPKTWSIQTSKKLLVKRDFLDRCAPPCRRSTRSNGGLLMILLATNRRSLPLIDHNRPVVGCVPKAHWRSEIARRIFPQRLQGILQDLSCIIYIVISNTVRSRLEGPREIEGC